MEKRRAIHKIGMTVLLTIVVLVLIPYMWMTMTSFKTSKDYLMHSFSLWPRAWTLEGYKKVSTGSPFFKWFLNGLLVTGSIATIVVFTSTITGPVFAKYNFWREEVWFAMILATMMVPSQVTMIPNFLVVLSLGLYNKLTALIVPQMARILGVFLCRQAIEDIPDNLCEATKIDEAGDFMIYWRIILPDLKPIISSLGILTALAMWNNYLNPLIMLDDVENVTLPIAMNYFADQYTADTGAIMAAAALVALPMLTLSLSFQRQFIEGSTLSGIR